MISWQRLRELFVLAEGHILVFLREGVLGWALQLAVHLDGCLAHQSQLLTRGCVEEISCFQLFFQDSGVEPGARLLYHIIRLFVCSSLQ